MLERIVLICLAVAASSSIIILKTIFLEFWTTRGQRTYLCVSFRVSFSYHYLPASSQSENFQEQDAIQTRKTAKTLARVKAAAAEAAAEAASKLAASGSKPNQPQPKKKRKEKEPVGGMDKYLKTK